MYVYIDGYIYNKKKKKEPSSYLGLKFNPDFSDAIHQDNKVSSRKDTSGNYEIQFKTH